MALYRLDGGQGAWIFAEHDGRSSARSASSLEIGRSSLSLGDDGLSISFDEMTSPFPRPALPRRLRGSIRLRGDLCLGDPPVALDERGEHRWSPLLPQGDLEVDVPDLGLRWRGAGYHDANVGDSPLHRAFRTWSWGRFHRGDHALIVYNTQPLSGPPRAVSLRLSAGKRRVVEPTPSRVAGRGAWGVPVLVPSDEGAPAPRILHTLEDSPFYGRHHVEATVGGVRSRGITEVLSAERFAQGWVRFLLPFRMRFSPPPRG